jgi:hypothetical protein
MKRCRYENCRSDAMSEQHWYCEEHRDYMRKVTALRAAEATRRRKAASPTHAEHWRNVPVSGPVGVALNMIAVAAVDARGKYGADGDRVSQSVRDEAREWLATTGRVWTGIIVRGWDARVVDRFLEEAQP